jgi:flagellar assembly factor FliW
MKWKNVQFGEFEYNPEHVLEFADGLIGFEAYRKYILINDEDSQPFVWLVSLEDPELSFPLIDPMSVLNSYICEPAKQDTTVLVIASLRENIEQSTVNLRSPLVIENQTQKGRQIILENNVYPFHQPLFTSASIHQKG